MRSDPYEMDVRFGDALFSVLCWRSRSEQNAAAVSRERFIEPRHSHPYYETHIFFHNSRDDSKIAVTVGDRVIMTPRRSALILSPGTEHAMVDLYTRIGFSFRLRHDPRTSEPEGFCTYFQELLNGISHGPIPFPVTGELISAVRQLHDIEDVSNIASYCQKQALCTKILSDLFVLICASLGETAAPQTSVSVRPYREPMLALDTLVTDFGLSLGEIAHAIGYSPAHTKRLIRKRFGTSLREVRGRLRIKAAKYYLEHDADLSIGKIAELSGFSDTETMRLAFLKQEGCPPSQYRKQFVRSQEEHETYGKP